MFVDARRLTSPWHDSHGDVSYGKCKWKRRRALACLAQYRPYSFTPLWRRLYNIATGSAECELGPLFLASEETWAPKNQPHGLFDRSDVPSAWRPGPIIWSSQPLSLLTGMKHTAAVDAVGCASPFRSHFFCTRPPRGRFEAAPRWCKTSKLHAFNGLFLRP